MRGIDISNWQDGLSLASLNGIDFAIFKATGGTSFVDKCCDPWVQEAKRMNLPWGFYHFAGDFQIGTPENEAQFFLNNTINYFGEGIPILDWEVDIDVAWVNKFVKIVHDETSVWPWIYANPWRFNQGGVEANCMRWIASYPDVVRPTLDYDPGEPPYTDGLVGCWQYASDGYVPGYDGNLDVNHFFGDRNMWMAYVGKTIEEPVNEPHVLEDDEYKVTIERK